MRSAVMPPERSSTGEPPPAALPAPVTVGEAEQAALLALARAAIAVAAGAAPPEALDEARRRVPGTRRAAVFVTLTEGGELRGCMGSLDPDAPVAEAVAEAAGWATRGDPRFRPVRRAELDRLEVGVSILGPLVPLAEPEAFRLGTDGIVVRRGQRRGLLLPEVAEKVRDRRAMLEIASEKAGLARDAWRHEGTEVLAFRTARFGGPVVAAPGDPPPGDPP
jgi:AmmeMemoRadiSam system protein A